MTKASSVGLRAYLASREQGEQLAIRADMVKLVGQLAPLRQRAIAQHDAAQSAQLSEPQRGLATAMEEELQTLRALVRESDRALTALRQAIQAADQLERVEAGLVDTLNRAGAEVSRGSGQ